MINDFPYILSKDGKTLLSVDETIEELIIEDGIETIGERAFCLCTKLRKVEIPESVSRIESRAFVGTGIEQIFLPKSVTFIGEDCFSGCAELISIDVADDNPVFSSIDGVLYDKKQTTLLIYPMKRTEECYEVPSGVSSIGPCAFEGSCLSSVFIPKSVSELGESAFAFCRNLQQVSIPFGVVNVEDLTFLGCESLEKVELPESISYIGGYAFSGCQSLFSIRIPSSVRMIDEKAFRGCKGLTRFYCAVSEPCMLEVSDMVFDDALFEDGVLYAPSSCLDSYREHPVFGKFSQIKAMSSDGEV